jgi:hypothetical protein
MNQGAPLQAIASGDARLARLARYQQEMHDFETFLKQRFFAL